MPDLTSTIISKVWGMCNPLRDNSVSYDSKLIYVVTVAKDTDTDKEMVIWTPATYSEKHAG